MTLLGKLFRPWDLPQDGNSEEAHPTLAQDEICDKSEKNLRRKPNLKRDHVSKRLERRRADSGQKSDTQLIDKCLDKSSGDRCGSECSSEPWPQCSADCSPATLESSQSPLFLHSSAINNLANLSRTELTAMGLLPRDGTSHKVKRQRPKRFHCPHCQVAFSNNGQLRGHIRIHTGEWWH